MLDRQIENAQLLFDTAVEFAVILMAAACSENCAVRISMKKLRDGPRSEGRVAKVIETEFEKVLAGLGFPAGLFEQTGNIRQTERNADLGKSAPLGHIWFIRISEGTARPTVSQKHIRRLNGNDIERCENVEFEPGVRRSQ